MTSFSRKKLRLDTDWTITKLKILNIHYLELTRKSECLGTSSEKKPLLSVKMFIIYNNE